MSLDYTCYSLAMRPLPPRKIADASPKWVLEFVDETSGKPLHKGRCLPSYCVVWGCLRSSRIDLAAMVRTGDAVTMLRPGGLIGCCHLEIESAFEADPDVLADLPLKQQRILGEARSRYDARTSAGQNDCSWQLQMAVCTAVALAVGGLLEDPQSGTFRAVAAKLVRSKAGT